MPHLGGCNVRLVGLVPALRVEEAPCRHVLGLLDICWLAHEHPTIDTARRGGERVSFDAPQRVRRRSCHAQRRCQAQHAPLDQALPCFAVKGCSPRHFKQLLVRYNQHFCDALEFGLHASGVCPCLHPLSFDSLVETVVDNEPPPCPGGCSDISHPPPRAGRSTPARQAPPPRRHPTAGWRTSWPASPPRPPRSLVRGRWASRRPRRRRACHSGAAWTQASSAPPWSTAISLLIQYARELARARSHLRDGLTPCGRGSSWVRDRVATYTSKRVRNSQKVYMCISVGPRSLIRRQGPEISNRRARGQMFAVLQRWDVHDHKHGWTFHATETDPKKILSSSQGRTVFLRAFSRLCQLDVLCAPSFCLRLDHEPSPYADLLLTWTQPICGASCLFATQAPSST